MIYFLFNVVLNEQTSTRVLVEQNIIRKSCFDKIKFGFFRTEKKYTL